MSLPRRFASALLDAVFPPRCVVCGAAGSLLCATCRATIRAPEPPLCAHCGRSLAGTGALPMPSAGAASPLCELCTSGQGPASLTSLRVAAVYVDAVRQAVLALKYRNQRRAAPPLGSLLTARLRGSGWQPDVIVPVPLHRDRMRRRGYNQAQLLARQCSRETGIPLRANLLIRQRDTRPQVGLSSSERRGNVSGAFALASPRAAAFLAGKRILLVDDVATTGSTLNAAASALLPARPSAIWGLAVTRPDLAADNADAYLRKGARGGAVRSGVAEPQHRRPS